MPYRLELRQQCQRAMLNLLQQIRFAIGHVNIDIFAVVIHQRGVAVDAELLKRLH